MGRLVGEMVVKMVMAVGGLVGAGLSCLQCSVGLLYCTIIKVSLLTLPDVFSSKVSGIPVA